MKTLLTDAKKAAEVGVLTAREFVARQSAAAVVGLGKGRDALAAAGSGVRSAAARSADAAAAAGRTAVDAGAKFVSDNPELVEAVTEALPVKPRAARALVAAVTKGTAKYAPKIRERREKKSEPEPLDYSI